MKTKSEFVRQFNFSNRLRSATVVAIDTCRRVLSPSHNETLSGRSSVLALAMISVVGLSACQPGPGSETPSNISPLHRKPPTGTPVPSEQLTKYDSADGLPLEKKLQCAMDICGPITPSNSSNAATQADAAAMSAEYNGLLNESIRVNSISANRLLDRIIRNRAAIEIAPLEPKHRAVVNLLWAISIYPKIKGAWRPSVGRFDALTLQRLRPGSLSEAELTYAATLLTDYLTSSEFTTSRMVEAIGFDTYISNRSSDSTRESKIRAAREFATDLKARLLIVQQEYAMIQRRINPVLDRLIAGEDVESIDLLAISEDIGTSYMAKLANEKTALFTQHSPNVAPVFRDFYQLTLPKKQLELRPAYVRSIRESAFRACGETISHIAEMKPQYAAVISRGNQIIEEVRAKALVVALEMSGSSLANPIQSYGERMRFRLPQTADLKFAQMKRLLVDKTEAERRESDGVQNLGPAELALNVLAMRLLEGFDDEIPFVSDCRKHDPLQLTDKSFTLQGQIEISWKTLINPETAYAVIAHEFGHAFSDIFKASKEQANPPSVATYDAAVACTITRHEVDPTRTETIEEDFADLFAHRVTKLVDSTRAREVNFGCLLADHDEFRYGTSSGLSLKSPAGDDDTHSTDFYRMIQLELDRGRTLSPACASLVDQGLPQMRRTCS